MNENNKFDVVGTNIAEKATMIWNVADMLTGRRIGAQLSDSAQCRIWKIKFDCLDSI